MHRKSGTQFSICGIKLHRRAPEPVSVQTEIDYDVIEPKENDPELKRKRIKDQDTVENDRHKDDVFTEKDSDQDGLLLKRPSKQKHKKSKNKKQKI
jgi:hypothetical protein